MVFTPEAIAVPLAAESVTRAFEECVLDRPITSNDSRLVLLPLAYIPAVICARPVPSPIIKIILVGSSWALINTEKREKASDIKEYFIRLLILIKLHIIMFRIVFLKSKLFFLLPLDGF